MWFWVEELSQMATGPAAGLTAVRNAIQHLLKKVRNAVWSGTLRWKVRQGAYTRIPPPSHKLAGKLNVGSHPQNCLPDDPTGSVLSSRTRFYSSWDQKTDPS